MNDPADAASHQEEVLTNAAIQGSRMSPEKRKAFFDWLDQLDKEDNATMPSTMEP